MPLFRTRIHRGPTEFEIQAWLWAELRGLGLDVRGEVPFSVVHRDRFVTGLRADLAEFSGQRLLGIIEVKSRRRQKGAEAKWRQGQQFARYDLLCVPTRLCCGMEEASELVVLAARGLLWSGWARELG